MMIQKYFFDPESLNLYFRNIIEKLRPHLHSNLIETIFVYLENSGLDEVKLEEAIKNLPDDMSERIMTLREQLIAKGVAKGLERGVAESLQSTILNAFDKGFDIATIQHFTGVSEDKVIKILTQNKRIAG